MDTTQARMLAVKAMNKHGLMLNGWVFQWDNAKQRLGQCNYRIKVLSFSKFLTEHEDEEEFANTVLHEIAHALVGPGHGHGIVWRRKMLEIGGQPNRCGKANTAKTEARKAAANYVVTCATTGKVVGHLDRLVKQRKTKRGLVKYLGHQCPCHREFVLYNGKTFQEA